MFCLKNDHVTFIVIYWQQINTPITIIMIIIILVINTPITIIIIIILVINTPITIIIINDNNNISNKHPYNNNN